jgi:cell division protein FtsL
MNTRAGHMGSLIFLKGRSANVRTVVLAALIVAGLMVYVGGKVQIMRLGYEIDGLETQKRELERANRALQIEASSLSSPSRIEEIAVKRLGMVRPSKENIVVVRRRPAPGATPPGAGGNATVH